MFKTIKEYPNYSINAKGECKNNTTGRKLTPRSAGKGYRVYGLRKNGKPLNHYVHRLVAEHFIPNPNNLPFVDHIDGNKTNNSIENLRWVTNYQNLEHYGFDKLANFSIDTVGVPVVAVKGNNRIEFKTKTDLLYHFGYKTNRTHVKIGEVYNHGKLKGWTIYNL